MKYEGKYSIFDSNRINTYPLKERINKVKKENLVFPKNIEQADFNISQECLNDISDLARQVVTHRKENKPVVLFSGAHLIKNGLGPLLVDLVNAGILTLVAGNAATAIHDFELALIGETSEYVPNALGKGQFGMAYEFRYINTALLLGNELRLGYGESLGKMICNAQFLKSVLSIVAREDSPETFLYPEYSVLAACYNNNIPFTVHAGIGVDVIDQHPSFDGQAKGGCSGRDFLIYTNEMTKFIHGGIVINIGSAVQGPEVLLKAISMVTNVSEKPEYIISADFDLRDYQPDQMTNESSSYYYFRNHKSVVTRVPDAFNGKGYYIKGDQKQTIPCFYNEIMKHWKSE